MNKSTRILTLCGAFIVTSIELASANQNKSINNEYQTQKLIDEKCSDNTCWSSQVSNDKYDKEKRDREENLKQQKEDSRSVQ